MNQVASKLMMGIAMLFTLLATAQDTFSDTFSSSSYGNNNGTQNFSGNWTEVNDDNSPNSGRIEINSNALEFNNLDNRSISRGLDLNGAASAVLTLDYNRTSGNESLLVQLFDGSTYNTIATLAGTGSVNYNLSVSEISSSSAIRFITGSGNWGGSETIYVDNVLFTAVFDTTDTDGDGIYDSTDLDDDNDGMTDEEEYCTTANATFLVSADVGTRSVVVNHTDTGYLRLDFSSMDNSFQLDINGTTVHPSVLEFENGALGGGEEYFLFQSDGAFISSPWVANSNGLPRLRLIVDANGQVNLYGTRTTSSTILEPMAAQFGTPFNTITWVPGNPNVFTLTNQSGPGPEGFSGNLFASAICDTDGDGISNELDLDSDNDGIYDIVEAGVLNETGVSDANNDGVIDGATSGSGANGLFNSIEDNDTAYAIPSYSIFDSDSDGTYDAFVLDSDADSCFDVRESGFTDDNNDGLLGPLPVTVDANGVVTSGSDGYTTPDDNDSNATYDYREAGSAPSISAQPTNITTCPDCTVNMSVTAVGDTFQWQLFNGTTWDDLSDTGIYSGTTTNTLTITNPTAAANNTQYRVQIVNLGFVCDDTISNVAFLYTQVDNVITNRGITYRVNKN